MTTSNMLHGIAVIELADEAGTRYCGRLLSVLGARVVRVARPVGAPTPYDRWLDEGKETAPDFASALKVVDGKPDVVLAGQTPERIRAADALIAERGLDTLRAGLTWFGLEGPYADWRGDDALIQALTGMAYGFGPVEGPPTLPQGRAPQIIGGATLYIAILAALWQREVRTVDASVLEASLCTLDVAAAGFAQTPGVAVRLGINRFAPSHPVTVYPASDGWIGVTTITPAQWVSLAGLIGRSEWASDPRFMTSPNRVLHADIINEALLEILPTRSSEYWLMEGQKLRIPLAPVPRPSELPALAHWAERGSFTPIPGAPDIKGPRLPFRAAFDGHARAATSQPGAKPLAGLKVIDFTMGWAGPLATRHLGDLGADVVKIESHTHVDWWRGWDPQADSDPPIHECMPNFNAMNRSKRGIALDLTTPEGVARAKALIAGADVVVENYAPGVMAKLGLGQDALLELRPGLVMLSMGAFGAVGPWSHFRAYGSTVEHASGFPHVNGHAEWPPCLQHVAYGDPIAGIYGAVAVLSALHGRARLGGAWVDLAQVECLFQLGANAIIAAQEGGDPPRMGSRNVDVAPRCVIATGEPDAAIAVAVPDAAAWQGLCRVIGCADWASDASLADAAGRNARADEIEDALARWAASHDAAEAAAALQNAGVPAAPVVPSHRLEEEPQLVANGAWLRLERRYVGRHLMAAAPYLLDGARLDIRRPSPTVGEHTAEVLADLAPA